MKFRDGYWGLKEGVRLINPVEVRDSEHTDTTLTLYSATRQIHHRGATLNSPLLTTEISSPHEDIIRVKTSHFRGGIHRGPDFVLNEGEPSVTVASDELVSSFTSGKLTAKIEKKDPVMEAVAYSSWALNFTREGRKLTEVSGRHSGHMTIDTRLSEHVESTQKETYLCQYLNLSVGETIYGLGERFTPFVKNGQVVDIWNEDGGTSSEIAYKNIPFYLSSKGYGIFVNSPARVQFEVASEVVTAVQFSVPGEEIDYFIVSGDTLKDVLSNYTLLTGRPALPPSWSFGLWLTTSFTTSYDEKTVTGFIDGMAERDIPLHVFHFDCFWMKEYRWTDFVWDEELFPEPDAMLKRLKGKGLNICVWINPYIAQRSRLFEEGMANGYLVKNYDGSVWQWDRWQSGMGLVDFTNPDACTWYREGLRTLVRQGVDTFKTDFGERIPTDVVYHDGSDPMKMHNYYTYLYNQTVFTLLEEELGVGKALVFARSATAGGQKFPVHWGGDCSATYESMAETLRGGLSLALSGFGFWSHDISGFELTATPDLYKRWIAFGSFSSHSRLHGNESYRVPWNFDDESSDVLRFFTRLKCSLMPYIYREAISTHESGVPMMRPMILEYPEDPTCAYLDRQYFFGSSLLTAPLFSEDSEVTYYLPEGSWTHFITGKQEKGGAWKTEQHDYLSLPLMVPQNTVIPVGAVEDIPSYDYAEDVTFHFFDIEESAKIDSPVYSSEGKLQLTLNVERTDDTLTLNKIISDGEKAKKWNVLLRGVDSVVQCSAGTSEQTLLGTMISFAPEVGEAEIRL